ncbi:proteinaceous RNase P 1, chloroplastic/mitochondrial-like isoform X1 [Solanum stenotomum]|uniref:proteinaceous RNase P 1, chloroplastic/mitochondrial-like isoform X1 n=1 Tax=Solanum stenotomum TaxID=172797 RepID=UPI0020D0FAB3|nr:proteinaceous RNase P 1, chloroplastic/mitochondrial-like isoform X1 [Solanum stenotomum]
MASIPFKPLQPTQFQFQLQLYSSTILLNPFKFHTTLPRISSSIHVTHVETTEQEISHTRRDSKTNSNENGSGFSSFAPKYKRVDSGQENGAKRVVLRDRNAKLKPKRRTSESSSSSSTNNKKAVESKKSKIDSTLRIGLDMCSKRGDVLSAIRLYDLALLQGIVMGQYHYAVLLYLCASAATGLIHPAKSGSGSRTLNAPNEPSSHNNSNEFNVIDHDSHLLGSSTVDEFVQFMKSSAKSCNLQSVRHDDSGIKVSEDVRHYALTRGFEIYEKMLSDKVQMNEATLTSVARMAMALGNGDMAFHVVKKMKEDGINPKLRSYGPSLSVFCNNGDVDKAFIVEQHMLENGIYPEEPELEALLKVSIDAGRSERVYYLLHKLREGIRQVSPSTADLIDKWFNSKVASRVGKRKWDVRSIHKAIKNGGGGWHGQGWLGNGKWTVSRAIVGSDGCCKCCAEKLVTIDLDPEETEKFAKSVASIAAQRERNSSFQKFQRWLDYYGPFEAVIDGANVGLYSQRKFRPSKVNAVVNGIRQMLPSKKWPLIVLHNRRITGDKMDEPFNRSLVEKWKNADAIYATPTGSNDDWYWLYAAIKFRCLLVTNDEMRDHLFQLLGNDFFPKWKERHQVRFSFSETGPVFHMPPPCSIVIQESEEGYWHVPIASELESEEERTWLCIRRANSPMANQDSSTVNISKNVGDPTHKCPPTSSDPPHNQGDARSSTRRKNQVKVTGKRHGSHGQGKEAPEEIYRSLKNILQPSITLDHCSILPELKAAEELGSCVVDFQI